MKKYIPVTLACLLWMWTPIFIKLLSFHFDIYTQNFYRYLGASFFLLGANCLWNRREVWEALRKIRLFIIPAVLISLFQTVWVKGIYLLEPGIAVLLSRSSILFVTVFSFIIFRDERRIIKSRAFILGSLLAIIGVSGVILGKLGFHFQNFNLGVVFILIGAFIWSCYVLTIKTIVGKINPLVAVNIVFLLSLPFFLVGCLLFGDITALTGMSKGVNSLLFISGILGVGIANAFNYQSIKLIGTAITSSFVLVTPFLTAALSYFFFGEVLTLGQILFGLVLITGCGLLVLTRR